MGPVVVNFVPSVSSPEMVPESLLYLADATWPFLASVRNCEYGMLLPSSVLNSCEPNRRAATTPIRIQTVHRGRPGVGRPWRPG